jgi:hypothetical protein
VQRYVTDEGFVRNEGDVQIGGFSPYAIGYGSLLPKRNECENLLVPVCLSASHIAFGSIRMEPVFMVLGQSSATAAMQAIQDDVALHDLNFEKLQAKLIEDHQVLEWTGPKRSPVNSISLKQLKGLVVDDEQAERIGFDSISRSIGPHIDLGYRHDGNVDKGSQSAKYRFKIKKAGSYAVRVAYTANPNRATNVPIIIRVGRVAVTEATLNQKKKPDDGAFTTVLNLKFPKAGVDVEVEISNKDTNGYVIIDAIQLLPNP